MGLIYRKDRHTRLITKNHEFARRKIQALNTDQLVNYTISVHVYM